MNVQQGAGGLRKEARRADGIRRVRGVEEREKRDGNHLFIVDKE